MFFLLCAVFMIAAVVARVYDRNLDPIGHTGISGRISLTCYSAMWYPFKSLVPDHLHAFYMRPVWEKLFSAKFVGGMIGTVAVLALLSKYRKRVPGLVAAWAVYLVILAPVSGVITTGMQVAADRYAYLTMMAFVVPVAIGLLDLSRWVERYRPPAFLRPAMASVVILGLMTLTFMQCRTWKDSEALWSTGIQNGAGHVADLHNNLGAVWASRGHFDLAIMAFNEALRLRPGTEGSEEEPREGGRRSQETDRPGQGHHRARRAYDRSARAGGRISTPDFATVCQSFALVRVVRIFSYPSISNLVGRSPMGAQQKTNFSPSNL